MQPARGSERAHALSKRFNHYRGAQTCGKVETPALRALVTRYEGLRLKAYRCSSGKLTIGYGHTHGVKAGQTITREQAERYLTNDINWYRSVVNRSITKKMTPAQETALISFAFNVGSGRFATSSVVKHFNAGNPKRAAERLLLYNKDSRLRVLKGLRTRRAEEAALLAGDEVS